VKYSAVLLTTALVASTGVLHAAGSPAPQQKTIVEEEVAAPPAAVWKLIANFHDMSWLPPVTKTEGEGGNKPGATRVLILAGGGRIQERLKAYDAAGHSYTYVIDRVDPNKAFPVAGYTSRIKVKAAPGGGSLVSWSGTFTRADTSANPAAGMDDQAAIDAVTGVYQAGLDNLKKLAAKGS
jgi:carbon monoxide dehydrogenase subunit G